MGQAIMGDGLKRYGPRVWSSMVMKRLKDGYGDVVVRSRDVRE